jgi:hypothetical protein
MANDFSTPPSPIAAWEPSTLMEDDLLEMEACGLILKKVISGWKCC